MSEGSVTRNGTLSSDSPALFAKFKRIFKAEEIAKLEVCYKAAVRLGALEESPVKREKDASYNPKPARVCQILMQVNSSLEALEAAMLMCASPTKIDLTPGELSDATSLAKHALKEFPSAYHRQDPRIEGLFLALKLDALRHLHMTSFTNEKIRALLVEIQKAILPNISHPENIKLKELLSSTVKKIERRILRDA